MNPGLLGLVTALCWGVGDFAARFTSRAIGAAQTLMILAGVSALALTPLALTGNVTPLWDPATFGLTVLAGLISTAAVLLLFMSLAQGPLGIVVPVTSSYPLPLVLTVMVMGDLTLTLPLAFSMAATIGGVWVVARAGHKVNYHEDHARGPIKRGIFLAGSAAVIFAVGILVTEAAISRSGEVEVIWLSRVVGFIVLALFLVPRRQLKPVAGRLWLLLIAMGVIDTVGFLALFSAHGTGGMAIASVASAAYGVVTVGLARLFLKEPVRPLQWMGFAMVISGAVALTLLSS